MSLNSQREKRKMRAIEKLINLTKDRNLGFFSDLDETGCEVKTYEREGGLF